MKTLTKFSSAAFAGLILAMSTVAAHGKPASTPRPRPTPAPRPTPLRTADIGSSYSNSKVPYTLDGPAILQAIGHTGDPTAVGYGDFNGDGIPDVVFGPVSGTTEGLPIIIACGQPGGGYIDCTTQVISSEVPAPIGPHKILVADFNGDGWPDIFIADNGLDAPPYSGSHNWLLLSDGTGHLVYQGAFSTIDLVGYHGSATAGDIDHSGRIDIFVEANYFLINDGQGHFTVDTTRVPASLIDELSCELIDIDGDGNLDLVIEGWQGPLGAVTEIFWGDGTGFYSDANKTVLPGDAGFFNVLNVGAEDLNHDGLRDLVLNRDNGTGFYFQVLMQTSPRVFSDESLPRLIHDRGTWIGNNFGEGLDWIRLVDMTGNGAPDLVIDGAGDQGLSRHLGWANDGNGYFTFTGGWSNVIWTTPLVGGTFSPPAPGTYTYDVNWGEAIDPASVQPADLTLSGIQGTTVTGVALVHGNWTTEFTLNIPTGGSLTARIAAGAITDVYGRPNAAFSGNYTVPPARPSATPRPRSTPPPRP